MISMRIIFRVVYDVTRHPWVIAFPGRGNLTGKDELEAFSGENCSDSVQVHGTPQLNVSGVCHSVHINDFN